MTKRGIVYLVGVILLGLGYYPIRHAVDNDILFVALAITYLIALRFIGAKWEKAAGGSRVERQD